MFGNTNMIDILNKMERMEYKIKQLEYQVKACQNKYRELESRIEKDENLIKGTTVKILNSVYGKPESNQN